MTIQTLQSVQILAAARTDTREKQPPSLNTVESWNDAVLTTAR